jgi:superfamily I DNA and/or RNA helicase
MLSRRVLGIIGKHLPLVFKDFTRDYPVLLSTCPSLRASIANGYLLDYLIIDEASQVDLLAAGLALSC